MDDAEAPIAALCFAVKQHQRTVGLAARIPRARRGMDDPVCWTLSVYEFLDNEQYSNLDALLTQLAPSECFVPADGKVEDSKKKNTDAAKVRALLERRGVQAREAKAASYKMADLGKCLATLVGDAELLAAYKEDVERPAGTRCLAALISELRLGGGGGSSSKGQRRSSGGRGGSSQDDDPEEEQGGENEYGSFDAEGASSGASYELVNSQLGSFMRLDSSAAEAVNLLRDPRAPRDNGSLFQVLNRCRTRMGARLLERWLRQPLLDRAAIETRHDVVGALKEAAQLRVALQDGPLKRCPDLEALRTRMMRRGAGLADLYRLYCFTQSLPSFAAALEPLADDLGEGSAAAAILRERFAAPLAALQGSFRNLAALTEHVVDTDRLPDLVVSPKYSEELAQLREKLDETREEVEQLHEDARNSWCSFADPILEADKVRGFVLRTTQQKHLQALKKVKTPQVEVISVLKNGIHFTTSELRQAGKAYLTLRRDYEAEQSGLVAKALETAATYLPVVEAASAVIAELDVLASFAEAAALATTEYVRPTMRDRGSGVIRAEAARHPCLECQEGVAFIPNGYDLQRGRGGFAVVTGPNMGGKSTYIRTLGALAVMAQAGSFVPADEAELSIVDAVYARVGAGDAQQRGVSTFMAEMLEAGAILNDATQDSLVLVDELGRGTSTYDGFGLAWGISEYLVQETRCFCLFATHFHEMTKLAEGCPEVQNLHVEAHVQDGQVAMLYQVKPGPCLQSFGIHVAKMAGFPGSVLREAKRKAAALETFEMCLGGREEVGMSNGGAYEGADGSGAGEKRQQRQEGPSFKRTATAEEEQQHKCFAVRFKQLPFDLVGREDKLENTRSLQTKIYACA